jgi:hypothetical protein
MSGKSKRLRSPLAGYDEQARRLHPGYVRKDAPCDVPTCGKLVDSSRTVTLIPEDGPYLSILGRFCDEHMRAPIDELTAVLPALQTLTADLDTGYMDDRGEEA